MSPSLRRLDLRINNSKQVSSFLGGKACKTFIESPLSMQCEELLIKVENRDSVLDLIDGMSNLRMLHIDY
jgi:hypothetical protein